MSAPARRGALRRAALLGFLALAVASAACSPRARWAALRAELEAFQGQGAVLTAPPGYLDLRGAIHVHSHVSADSEGSHAELLAGARAAELDFVVMTEHATPTIFTEGLSGRHEDVLVIPGMEIIKGCRGLADRCATLLAIGFDGWFDPRPLDFQEVVDEVNRRGGLAFVAHPRGWRDWSVEGVTGLEIYDVLDDALDRKWAFPKYALDVLHAWDDWPDEVFLQIQDRPEWHLRRWDELLRTGRWVGIAGNDAHRNVRILGRQIDPYERSFRFVTTHVWAWSDDQEAVLSALVSGHAYVAFDVLADPTGFWFGNDAVQPSAIAGDEITLRPDLSLVVRTPLAGRIELLRDGSLFARCNCRELSVRVEEAGIYRVEVFLHADGGWRPWIFSNPIYVR